MLLHGHHACGCFCLPGDEESSRKKCGEAAERIAGKGLSRRGMIRARSKWSSPACQTIAKMMGTEWARRDEDVGVGFTSIGVSSKKL